MMRPFQKSSRRQQRHQARRLSKRFSSIETLENRALLTGIGFEVDLGSNDGQPDVAEVGSSSHGEQRVLRIVNGEQTSDHESVGIVNQSVGCSGTLIAPNAVLTAAHCIPDDTSEAQDFTVGGKTYEAAKVVIHPEYGSRDIDLAVMILKENVTGVEPSEINRTAPQVGQMLTLVGFGGTGTAQGGHNGDFGVKHEGQTPLDELTDTGVNWNFDNANEANTAPGDSGGPAFIIVNGKLVVAGVTSGGTLDSAGLGDYSFDTRVDTFADWIDGVVAGGDGGTTGGDTTDETVDENDEDDPIDENPVDENPDDVDPGVVDADQEEAVALADEELEYYDTDGNGAISEEELVDELFDYGYDAEEASIEAADLIDTFDENGDGELDRDELIVSYGGEPEGFGNEIEDGNEEEVDLGDGEDDWTDDEFEEDISDESESTGEDLWFDFGDFLILSGNYGEAGDMLYEDGDLTGDGAVGFDDFLDLSQNYGSFDEDFDRESGPESTDQVFAEMCQ